MDESFRFRRKVNLQNRVIACNFSIFVKWSVNTIIHEFCVKSIAECFIHLGEE